MEVPTIWKIRKGRGRPRALILIYLVAAIVCGVPPGRAAAGSGQEAQVPRRFGVQSGLPRFAKELREAGIELVRDWIQWRNIEPVKGEYRWTDMDEVVRKANETGIEFLGYFIFPPDWAKRDPACKSDVGAIRDMADFRKLALAVAERYDGRHGHGRISYFEILNEVTLPEFFDGKNTRYEDWLVHGYEGVKAGNAEAKVLVGGFVNPTHAKKFVESMLGECCRYYDIVSFHVYEAEEDVVTATRYLKECMKARGVSKPIWMTETATILRPGERDALRRTAEDVIRRYVSAFGEGVEKVFWFPFVGPPMPEDAQALPGKPLKTLGLGWAEKGSAEFHERPAYRVYRLMTLKLGGFRSCERISETGYKFAFPNRSPVYVVWGDESRPSPVLPVSGTTKVTDCWGSERTVEAEDIRPGASPVFVEQ